MARTRERAVYICLSLCFTSLVSASRSFHSLDGSVRAAINTCANANQGNQLENTNIITTSRDLDCQDVLACILSKVDVATSARWSAGASILAFIPTLAALMSNGVNDLFLLADKSPVLAVLLAISSITGFVPRLGQHTRSIRGVGIIKEELRYHIEEFWHPASKSSPRSPSRAAQLLVLTGISALMVFGCGITWFAAYQIRTYSVVVFSCPQREHIIAWVGLLQATSISSILLKPLVIESRELVLNTTTSEGVETEGAATRKLRILLCFHKDNKTAKAIRGFTSLFTLALYTYATGVFAATTMYSASDALRALAMFATAAAIGRIVTAWTPEECLLWQRVLVFTVEQRHCGVLEQYVQDVARQAAAQQVSHARLVRARTL